MLTDVLQIWTSGGWVMIPLFALAVVLYTQALRLVLYVRRSTTGSDNDSRWWEWVTSPSKAQGPIAEIIRFTQADVATADQIRSRFDEVRGSMLPVIDERTRFLATLVATAPLMGLLGTVLGMLQTFLGISTSAGTETAGVVAAGISEALVTTQTGLTIALPGLFVVMMIQRKRRGLEARLARLESLTLTHFKFE